MQQESNSRDSKQQLYKLENIPSYFDIIFIAFSGLINKEVKRILRLWIQTLLPSAITTLLYFLIFGNLIGRRIGNINDTPYITFIVPGLIMMAVINNSYTNVAGSFFSTKFMKNLEVLLVSPVPSWVILSGYVGGGLIRGLLVGAIVALLSLLFTQIQPFSIAIMLLIITITAIIFSLAGLVNAMFAKRFDDIAIIPVLIITPLTYLGGVFYSINMLPDFFKTLSYFNPIVYMISAFRFGILGKSDIPIAYSISLLSILLICFSVIAVFLMHTGKGLRK